MLRIPHPKETAQVIALENATLGDEPGSIYVGNVDYAVTDDDLIRFFSVCGAVDRVTIPRNKDNSPKGFAYLKFVAPHSVTSALTMDGADFFGRVLKITPKRINVPGLKTRVPYTEGSVKAPSQPVLRHTSKQERPRTGREVLPGDWMCPACGSHNFNSRKKCRKCPGSRPGVIPPLPSVASSSPGPMRNSRRRWLLPAPPPYHAWYHQLENDPGEEVPLPGGAGVAEAGQDSFTAPALAYNPYRAGTEADARNGLPAESALPPYALAADPRHAAPTNVDSAAWQPPVWDGTGYR
eukprot:TRINITY_DN44732_c0_g1_i1.p1 TRINITY_DN44732_c0_g1~~TRINITY_DN44732_c0_g1_i1.p1  ORF type:complete len:295 (+),score=37.47 TRINITY_DN44732_c0_g1_i1:52-936(+)